MSKILLHICCAPCGAYVIEKLKDEGYEPIVFFSNDNIMPREEYNLRRQEVETYFNKQGIRTIIDDYQPREWLRPVEEFGLKHEPEGGRRCEFCYHYRLVKTATKAKELNIINFATTLTISPHKQAGVINQLGQQIGIEYGLQYLDSNWKKQDGYKRSCEIARNENFYRQTYCGCPFSKTA